jgi:CRISPR/Cas system CSM-associated protein Csm2 small subunit
MKVKLSDAIRVTLKQDINISVFRELTSQIQNKLINIAEKILRESDLMHVRNKTFWYVYQTNNQIARKINEHTTRLQYFN